MNKQVLQVTLDGGTRVVTNLQPNLTNIQLVQSAIDYSQFNGGQAAAVGDNVNTPSAVYNVLAVSGVLICNNLPTR